MQNDFIKTLFTPELIIQTLQNLPKLNLPVMDTIFSNRTQLPFSSVAYAISGNKQ